MAQRGHFRWLQLCCCCCCLCHEEQSRSDDKGETGRESTDIRPTSASAIVVEESKLVARF